MAQNYASYFGATAARLKSLADCLLAARVADGSFNCRHRPTQPVRHSSLHTTVSALEGIHAYRAAGHRHRVDELEDAATTSVEFLLRHELFRSERTGKTIRDDFTRLHHPPRWHFDILRGSSASRPCRSRRTRGWAPRSTCCAPADGTTGAGQRAPGRVRRTCRRTPDASRPVG